MELSVLTPSYDNYSDEFEVHEFIWMNSHPNISAQRYYIGAELVDNFLSFYLIDLNTRQIHFIKSYQLNDLVTDKIDDTWFDYKETSEKCKLLIFSPNNKCTEIVTDKFIISHTNGFMKIIQISIVKDYITIAFEK